MRTMRAWVCAFGICVAIGFAACQGPPATPSRLPGSGPGPSPPSPRPPDITFSLSGVVFDGSSAGSTPLPNGLVFYTFDNGLFGHVNVDATGRYTIANLSNGRFVRVTAHPSAESGLMQQRCPTSATIAGDTSLDIELSRHESRATPDGSPILSGVVFETTVDGRHPIEYMSVIYTIGGRGLHDVYTFTDANGRYEFCRIPPGRGAIASGDCNDAMETIPIDVHGDTVFDIDLTRFNASCRR